MNNPAAQEAAAFYRMVARNRCVWTLRDEGGYAAPMSATGRRAQPFWSSRARALRIVRTVEAYEGFEPVLISWSEFRDRWLPGLEQDGVLVGVNWSGDRAIGYDLEPATVLAKCQRAMAAIEREEQALPDSRAGSVPIEIAGTKVLRGREDGRSDRNGMRVRNGQRRQASESQPPDEQRRAGGSR